MTGAPGAGGGGRQLDRVGLAALAACACLAAVLIGVLTPWSVDPGPAVELSLADHFSAAEIARSDAYFARARWPSWAGLLTSIVVPLLIAFTSAGRRCWQPAMRRVGHWWLQVPAVTGIVVALTLLARMPFLVWSSLLARDAGLVTQPWGGWLREVALGTAVEWVLTSVGLLVLVAAARRWRRWYLPLAAGAAAATFALSLAYPYITERLTMSTTPMPASPQRTALLDLAGRTGADVSEVLVADASTRTTAQNAYVAGLGPSRRLVVYDTLLAAGSPAEVRVIVAHELAHATYDDVRHGTVIGAAGAATGVLALGLVLGRRRARGRPGADDPAMVPTVLALAAVATFAISPLVNTISRQVEERADLFSLELTRDPQTFIAMQRSLALSNLNHLDPNPVLAWWFSSHPTTLDRIEAALRWQAAHARGRHE